MSVRGIQLLANGRWHGEYDSAREVMFGALLVIHWPKVVYLHQWLVVCHLKSVPNIQWLQRVGYVWTIG